MQEYNFVEGNRILDPACGSGSFLIAAVHRFRELNPNISVEEINSSIYGIDIHPLSVQIAKTNMLLALGRDVVNSRSLIHLNIILANTLLAPDGVKDLFGTNFKMNIDKETLELSSQILDDVKIFDKAIDVAEELAEDTYGNKKVTIETFTNTLKRRTDNGGFNKQVVESFYKIYHSLCKVKTNRRDSIWKFIVQNLYKPYFLSSKFDYVIGNPPWFTYSSIRNEEYQNILNELANNYNVKPERVANFPHLEIAAIFYAYCSNYFLKENGKISFVLPRSFFSADHHDNTRSGKAKGFKLNQLWDLNNVSPLFRVPTSVLFGDKAKDESRRSLPASGITGISLNGKLPVHNLKYFEAKKYLTETKVKWYYTKQGSSSAFTNKKYKTQVKPNPYKSSFRQGATIVPRSFYFVQLEQEMPDNFEDKIINIKTAEAIKADAKMPWKEIELSGRIESQFLFRTALSKSILPFALYKPDLVVLPITIKNNDQNEKEIQLYSADDLMSDGFLNASRWFRDVENMWNILKTEKSKNMTNLNRLNFQKGLADQNLNAPYLVIYNSSAVDANSTMIDRNKLDLEFIVESKAYTYFTETKEEAFYLSAIFNSSIPNKMMKDFQSRGLWGARDVHKKILDIYFQKFDDTNEQHLKLAELSKTAHEKAEKYTLENPPQQELTATRLGRYRVEIKKHLHKEMREIDKLVKRLLK